MRRLCFLIVVLLHVVHASGQDTLTIDSMLLDAVVLVGRTDQSNEEIIGQIESIKSDKIQSTSPQTSAEVLGQHGDVFVQKSQMGGGSPVVRGFEANKVLLVVDGVRMNNAIYRSGHLHNAITIDPSILDRAEVIYGPGSLLYGSDALGGVVHFRTRSPRLVFEGSALSGNAYATYATANGQKTGHLDLNYGTKKWASLTSVTFNDFGDLRSGSRRSDRYPDFGKRLTYVETVDGIDQEVINDNVNLQVGTAYSQLDLLQKLRFQINEDKKISANFQYSTSSDVPRYDALTERTDNGMLRYAEWYYGPQDRILGSVRYQDDASTSAYDKLIAIVSYQDIKESRRDRRFGSKWKDYRDENVNVFSITTDLSKDLKALKLNYGLEYNYNIVNSIGRSKNASYSESAPSVSRYPSDGSTTSTFGGYIMGRKQMDKLTLSAGLRYSRNDWSLSYKDDGTFNWPQTFYDGMDGSNSALTWSVSGKYALAEDWHVSSQLASAFRAPNIDDLAKFRVKNNEVSVPNPSLTPEKAITSEVTVSKTKGALKLSATGFYTRLSDVIVRENYALQNGQTTIIEEGDTLSIVANTNAEQGRVRGISVSGSYDINQSISIGSTTSYIRGQQSRGVNETPLSHIPPLYGRAYVNYHKGKSDIQLVWRYNAKKPVSQYGSSVDNLEYATPEGTPAWNTWNIYYNYKSDNWRATIGLENILDVHYRPFSSGVSAPGRNVTVTVGRSF